MSTLIRSFKGSRKAQVGVVMFGLIVFAAIFADFIAPHDPHSQDLVMRFQPPVGFGGTWEHPLGTNNLGQDILSRLIYGSRVSLLVGFVGAFLAAGVGVPLALIGGYYGGRVDEAVMRVADIFLSVPAMVLAVAIVGIFSPSPMNVVFVFVFVSWAWLARAVRSDVLSERERGYIEAAKVIGCSDRRIIARHLFPNVMATGLVLTTLYIAIIILWQAALAFLGLDATELSWGWSLAVGRDHLQTAWWLGTFPGIAIFITVISINLVGDWLRDALDVRTNT